MPAANCIYHFINITIIYAIGDCDELKTKPGQVNDNEVMLSYVEVKLLLS
jgi:hypothetical protein